jgi:hypothetical protein
VNFAFPHDPRQWPANKENSYLASQIPLPANFAARHPFDHGNLHGRDELLLPTPRTAEAVREELALYYAMITDLDEQLGRILDALPSFDDTLVIFTSDQGLALGSHGLLGKQNQYEHTIRSPLIITGPGLPMNARSTALVTLYDVRHDDSSWTFGLERTDIFQFVHAPQPITPGRRVHVATVRTGEEFRLFVDGQRVASQPEAATPLKDQSKPFSLSMASAKAAFSGDYDEVRVSRVARREADFGPAENLGPEINSTDNDGGAALSGDGLTLMFHRFAPDGVSLWRATRKSLDAPFEAPQRVTIPLAANEQFFLRGQIHPQCKQGRSSRRRWESGLILATRKRYGSIKSDILVACSIRPTTAITARSSARRRGMKSAQPLRMWANQSQRSLHSMPQRRNCIRRRGPTSCRSALISSATPTRTTSPA